jgi:UDP-galactopyranose mutase
MKISHSGPKVLVVGAGLSGAVLARQFALSGISVDIIEKRSNIAGNVFTQIDEPTGILKHVYGPHIFNTNNEEVWHYVNSFSEFSNFTNRVKSKYQGEIYSLPINLHTINQYFKKSLNPAEAIEFIEQIRHKQIKDPVNFEEQALSMVGLDLYQAFLKGYTLKQWGVDPKEIPASVLKRLPLRFNYNDNYYDKKYQGIPLKGYTHLVENIINHERISVSLDTAYSKDLAYEYSHIFYSGKIDEYFEYSFGELGYRTVYWEDQRFIGDFQGNPVMNYADLSVPYTRIVEHKHFAPHEEFEETIISFEYSKETKRQDEPFYPKRLKADMEILEKYQNLAKEVRNVTFIGRLGTYRYLDMDKVIEESFEIASKHLGIFLK